MMDFNELRKLDVTTYIQKRDGADYINWADMVALCYEHGATKVDYEVIFNEKKNPDGSVEKTPLFETADSFGAKDKPNRCFYVGVRLFLDDETYDCYGPVMNGAAAVNSTYMSQQRIHNTHMRLLAKKISVITGIGFSLWQKTENAEEEAIFDEMNLEKHDILKVKERVGQLITAKMSGGVTQEDMATACGMELDEFKSIFVWYGKLAKVERIIASL